VRVDRDFLVLVVVLSAVWWALTLARGCQGGRPRPLDVIPATERGGSKLRERPRLAGITRSLLKGRRRQP
jgi:hypothetical protein